MTQEKLKEIINNSEHKLSELKAIDYHGLQESINELESLFNEFKESGEKLLTDNQTLQIGIVGQVKAGKSSFLNSLFFNGEDVLPKASTPMTAGLTIIEYADKNTFEVEYFNEKDWDIFVRQDNEYKEREREIRAHNQDAPEAMIKKELENRTSEKVRSAHEMVSSCGYKAKEKIGKKNDVKEFYDIQDLQEVLEQYVGANGEYTSVVKSLYIKMNDDRLQGLRIVDTPGVNDPVISRENRTRTFLQACHGVFLLSASTDFLGSGDVGFLNSRIGGSGIGTVVLLASKFDSVLQDIGAEREMKNEERGDLVETVEMQTKKFKKRLRELSDTIDERLRGRIKLDVSAGIGYSIAHKTPDKWDNVERQVVQQMKRYYPDYFSTDADLKNYFEGLANIADIREKYLDGVFMDNKETIIAEKVNAFFIKNNQSIAESVNRIFTEYSNRKDQLNETTIGEIQKQKEIQGSLFTELKSTFNDIFNGFGRNIQNEMKTIGNNVLFHEIRKIPTEPMEMAITCKGWLWGHNTNQMSIDGVNSYELSNQIRDAIEEYARAWNSEWIKLFDKTRNELAQKLNESITGFESQIMSRSFKDTYYRGLIDKALDVLRDNKELNIGCLIESYQRQGDDIADKQFYPERGDTYDLKESEVKPYLDRRLREHNSYLIQQFRVLVDSLKQDMKTEVNKNLSNAINVITDMKTSFADNLKKEGDSYLASLEKDMAEKTEVLKTFDRILLIINELKLQFH